jgi:ABC-2 type transport system ATP-binding protein
MSDFAIEMSGVSKRYRFFSLEDIRLNVPEGQIMGLIGPNGAGKSTTIRILLGLVHQDSGEVRVLGHRMPAGQIAAKWDIGFASEDMRLYGGMTLDWHMRFIRSIYPYWDAKYAKLLLKRFGLRAEQKIKGLSHGQRVKATLLLVLARRPKLLVLDEPTTGLDPVARHEILRELTGVMADEGRSILFSSHHTQDVEQISDRITFIDRGRIIDSMDKEMYLDRWRRLRLEAPAGIELPALPGIIGVRQEGRLAVATANAFVPDLVSAYENSGARVQRVEAMTLEEIFVANVEHSREREEVEA